MSDRRGAAAVEFALLAPALLLMLAGVIDVGRLISQSMQVKAAAQAGADYAQRRGWDEAAVRSAVVSATPLAVTVDPAPRLLTACISGGAIVETTASTCGAGEPAGRYAAIGARAAFTPIMPWPGLVTPPSLDGQALVRIQ